MSLFGAISITPNTAKVSTTPKGGCLKDAPPHFFWIGGSDKSPLLGQQRNVLGHLLGGYGSGGLTTANPNNKKPPLSRGLLIQQSSKIEKKLNLGVQPQPMAGAVRATGVDSAAARSRGKL